MDEGVRLEKVRQAREHLFRLPVIFTAAGAPGALLGVEAPSSPWWGLPTPPVTFLQLVASVVPLVVAVTGFAFLVVGVVTLIVAAVRAPLLDDDPPGNAFRSPSSRCTLAPWHGSRQSSAGSGQP